jgi:hypothetical protein
MNKKSERGIPRDLLMVLIGGAIAIPGTLMANYLTNQLSPQTTTVSVQQVGVQQLNAFPNSFVFLQSAAARTKHEGIIEVVYGMGIDPSHYKCNVKVSNKRHFEKVMFDPSCRQVSFKFIDPALFFKGNAGIESEWNNTAVFSIEIVSDNGQIWKGSQAIEYAVAKGL